MELILAESIRVNNDKSNDEHHDTDFIDSTLQEKNVIYPTDAKLHKKVCQDQRFRNHPNIRKKAIKADRRLRTIAGRLVRELERNLGEDRRYDRLLSIFKKILSQGHNSSHKIYSIHEPDVLCVSKG